MDLGLKGKVALVTAASQGLGRACAEALAAEGVRVAICSRSAERISAAAAEITKDIGQEVKGFVCDLSQPNHIDRLVEQVQQAMGGIDILVFNHGHPPSGLPFSDIPLQLWKDVFNLCVVAAVQLSRVVIPGMKERKWGRIVFLNSIAAKEPDPNYFLSSSVRPGLLGFAKCLSRELAPYGVTVNSILPGHFDTPLLRELAKSKAEGMSRSVEDVLNEWSAIVPVGRIGRPLAVGKLASFLCSEESSTVTGAAIQIDGGCGKSII